MHLIIVKLQSLVLRLEVDFVLPLSQEEEQQQTSQKFTRTESTKSLEISQFGSGFS